MKPKVVIPREQVKRDIDEAVAYYLGEDARKAAENFVDELERAYAHIGCHPASGSP